MTTRATIKLSLIALLLSVGPVLAEEAGVFGYFRILDGSATLIQADTGVREDAEINQPILEGDSLWVAPRALVEVVLSDGARLRGDGETELFFRQFDGRSDRSTIVQMNRGNLQWVLPVDPQPEAAPRLDTDNATIYLHASGSYRLSADEGWTQVVVREGYAEVLTQRGSTVVRAGEQVRIDGYEQASIRVSEAPGLDSLEQWGQEQEYRRTDSASARYVGGNLGYSSAVLDDYGSWIVLDGRRAWRPYVSVGWRPYWNGRWSTGSLGMTWISNEPWGWVPHHYGSWDYWSGYGWVWYPGHVYSPARVHWYWGSGYAGWIPSGYYGRYYGWNLRAGLYGWAGGSWNHYHRWTFCSTRYLGHRRPNRHYRKGHDMHREHGNGHIGRGLITTDTRGIRPDSWHDPKDVLASLENGGGHRDRDLPDVTRFVTRERDLDAKVRERVRPTDGSPRLTRPDVARKPTQRDKAKPDRIASKTPKNPVTVKPTQGWRDSKGDKDSKRVDWRAKEREPAVSRIDLRDKSPQKDRSRKPTIDTKAEVRKDDRPVSRDKVTTRPEFDRERKDDQAANKNVRVDPRREARGDKTADRTKDIPRGSKVIDRKSRDIETKRRPSDDWRQGDVSRDRTKTTRVEPKVLYSMPSPSRQKTDSGKSSSERKTWSRESSRSWSSSERTSSSTPVVRRVVDSIRSKSSTSSTSTNRVDTRSRYESSSPRSSVNSRSTSRSETTYRSSSGRSTRPSSTSSRSDTGRSRTSSVSKSGSSRSGSDVKSRSSSTSRSSATRSSSSSKSSRTSSKGRKGKG